MIRSLSLCLSVLIASPAPAPVPVPVPQQLAAEPAASTPAVGFVSFNGVCILSYVEGLGFVPIGPTELEPMDALDAVLGGSSLTCKYFDRDGGEIVVTQPCSGMTPEACAAALKRLVSKTKLEFPPAPRPQGDGDGGGDGGVINLPVRDRQR